jgi:hypothetical protein
MFLMKDRGQGRIKGKSIDDRCQSPLEMGIGRGFGLLCWGRHTSLEKERAL